MIVMLTCCIEMYMVYVQYPEIMEHYSSLAPRFGIAVWWQFIDCNIDEIFGAASHVAITQPRPQKKSETRLDVCH